MRDVAARAGVSFKTVSRVVNAEAGVSTAVRERVQAAVVELNYRHNLPASNLRRAAPRTATVGALLQDVGNTFSAALLRAVENRLRERGVALLAASLDEEPQRERGLVADLVSRRVDGLVLMPASSSQEYLVHERQAGMPTVFVDRRPRGVSADSVTIDNYGGGRLAAEHLVRQGHRRIAMLGDLSRIDTASARVQGFLTAATAAGLSGVGELVRSDLRTPAAGQQALLALMALPDPPTAVFAARNELSIATVRTLRALGLAHQVAVVGFDDFPLADLLDPPLTVVRQDVTRMGSETGRLLFQRLDGDTGSPVHVVLEPVLVARGSGEIAPPRRVAPAAPRA